MIGRLALLGEEIPELGGRGAPPSVRTRSEESVLSGEMNEVR